MIPWAVTCLFFPQGKADNSWATRKMLPVRLQQSSLLLFFFFLCRESSVKNKHMRGHSDICLPACGSIRDPSVGCCCPDTSRQGNPVFIIENSFSSFIENDICASQESRSLEGRTCRAKFSSYLSSDLDLDIVSKMSTVQPSRPRRFGQGWVRAQVHGTLDNQVQFSQGLALSASSGGHSFPPYLAPPWFSGHAV